MSKVHNFVAVEPECGDWIALYMDGNLIAEGHSLGLVDVLDAINSTFPNTIDWKTVSDEYAESGFHRLLSDVEGVN